MKSKEFIKEDVHPDYDEFLPESPYENSLLKLPVYHATNTEFTKFERVAHGVFVSQYYDYAVAHYGANVIPLYVDVKNCYNGGSSAPFIDAAFDRDYKTLGKWLNKFQAEGYDAAAMYGDGSSIILIGDVPMVHAVTGKEM